LTYKKQGRMSGQIYYVSVCIMLTLLCGCSHFSDEFNARPTFEEANSLFSQGSYHASLGKYEEIIGKYPATADRVLFEMGIIHSHSKNEQKDYQKALECFEKLVREHPGSGFRQDSEMMIFYINNVTLKDRTIAAQQKQNGTLLQEAAALRQELKGRESDIAALQEKIAALEQKVAALPLLRGPADRILIEKKLRRLTLFSKGEPLKAYRIALGGNPVGPKERQGDNKTPEGTYVIDSRNKDSRYHLSLHISYPNERDKKRAKELGVSPGGDIMIHGIKNGFAWAGDYHTGLDWTKGCIAVTDEEIEEIVKVVPNGTVVEIRP